MTARIIALALLSISLFGQKHGPPARASNVALCDQFPGADASVKIAGCIASLPATGGTADARGIKGIQNVSVDLFAGSVGRPITLLLGDATFACPFAPIVNNACISLPSDTTIIGNGPSYTIITLPNGWNDVWYRTIANNTGATDFEIANIEVNGNQGEFGGTDRLTRQAHCIFVQQGIRFKIHGNAVHDCLGDAIEIWGTSTPSQYGKVYDNYLHDMIQAGVGLISVADTEVYWNRVDAGGQPAFGGIHGEPSNVGQWNYSLDIHDNTLLGGEGISDTSPVGNGLNTSHNSVHDNTLTGGGGILWMRNPYSEITANNIIGYLGDNAISVMSHDIRVLNNVITAQSPYVASNYSAAIGVDNSSADSGSGEAAGYGNNAIEGNTISGWIRSGLRINNSSWNQIMGNAIRNIQMGGTPMGAIGAYQQETGTGLTHDNQFIGNTIADTQAKPTMTWGISCPSGAAPSVALNDITNMVAGAAYGCANLMGTPLPSECSTGGGLSPSATYNGPVSCGQPFAGINMQVGNYLAVAGDSGKLLIMNCSSGCTLTLPSIPPAATWKISVLSISASTATISPNGLTYNGSTSASALTSYKTMQVWTDGSNYFGPTAPVGQ
jgi:hypothetical protein